MRLGGRSRIGLLLAFVVSLWALIRLSPAAGSEPIDPNSAPSPLISGPTNEPVQLDAQALHQAIEELRQQLADTSKELLERTARDSEALSQKVNTAVSERLAAMERTLTDNQQRDLASMERTLTDNQQRDLASMEQALTSNQQRELEALRSSHRTFLTFSGVLAGLGFLGIIVAAVVLARAVNRFSEVALALPTSSQALPAPPERPALGSGDIPAVSPAQVEEAAARFQEAVKRLEDRIRELENLGAVTQATHEGNGADEGSKALPAEAGSALKLIASAVEAEHAKAGSAGAAAKAPSEFALLLGKGQALLNLGKAQEALACFEEAIALAPQNAEAFVKKGMALERLQRMEQAIESYDQALAVDGTSTLAYLYKGAACNRLQRFQEALDCYEKALRTEQMSAAV